MNKDVLRDFLERLIVALNDQPSTFSEDLARQIESGVRQEWAGERSLILKDPDREARRQAAAQDLRRGESIQQVRDKHGISRAGVYRLLKKRG